MSKTPRGFTLIELLLVVGIIGMMSAIVMTGLSQSRSKAKDASIKRQLTEMRTLMAREMSDTGSYTNLKGGGAAKVPGATCTVGTGATHLKGTYATNFKLACDALIKTYGGAGCGSGGVCLQFNQPTGVVSGKQPGTMFSMYAYLPDASRIASPAGDRYLCMGSNGKSSISPATLSGAGCPNDTTL